MQKKKILIIDDDKNFCNLMKTSLEGTANYEVRVENKAALGLQAAQTFRPNLILLDIMMPEMDGSELAGKLMNDEKTRGIPVTFLTAAAKKEEVEAGRGVIAGHAFIAKPATIKEIIDHIEKNARI